SQSVHVLRFVWTVSGFQCGKYLARSMRQHLDALEYHGELGFNRDYYSRRVRMELLAMSAASIDRYLRRFRARAKRAAPVVRSSISINGRGPLLEAAPGFGAPAAPAHCVPEHGARRTGGQGAR